MNLVFVDFENVSLGGLKGIEKLSKNEIVYLFYSKNTPHLPMELVGKISESEALVLPIESMTGKNAMDFVIASFLGYKIKENDAKDTYYILSKDKGYKPLGDFWEDWDIKFITELSQIDGMNKRFNQLNKSEQALKSNIGRLLTGYNKDVKKKVAEIVLTSKNKKELNNKLGQYFKDTKKASEVYRVVKSVI